MTNNTGFIFVFVQKLLRTGESHLVQVFFYFFLTHPYASVADSEGARLLIQRHLYRQVAKLRHCFPFRRQRL